MAVDAIIISRADQATHFQSLDDELQGRTGAWILECMEPDARTKGLAIDDFAFANAIDLMSLRHKRQYQRLEKPGEVKIGIADLQYSGHTFSADLSRLIRSLSVSDQPRFISAVTNRSRPILSMLTFLQLVSANRSRT